MQPNEAKVVHHIMPKDDTKDWSAGWSCEADWISIEAMQTELNANDIEVELDEA